MKYCYPVSPSGVVRPPIHVHDSLEHLFSESPESPEYQEDSDETRDMRHELPGLRLHDSVARTSLCRAAAQHPRPPDPPPATPTGAAPQPKWPQPSTGTVPNIQQMCPDFERSQREEKVRYYPMQSMPQQYHPFSLLPSPGDWTLALETR